MDTVNRIYTLTQEEMLTARKATWLCLRMAEYLNLQRKDPKRTLENYWKYLELQASALTDPTNRNEFYELNVKLSDAETLFDKFEREYEEQCLLDEDLYNVFK